MNPLSKSHQTRRGSISTKNVTCPKCSGTVGRSGNTYVCVKCRVQYDSNLVRMTKKENKYNSQRCNCGIHMHMSRGEASCCSYFQLLEKGGELKILASQPNVFVTDAKLKIIPDWLLLYSDYRGERYADYKGCSTDSWGRNKRLWKNYGPRPMEVWKKNSKGFFVTELITPA